MRAVIGLTDARDVLELGRGHRIRDLGPFDSIPENPLLVREHDFAGDAQRSVFDLGSDKIYGANL